MALSSTAFIPEWRKKRTDITDGGSLSPITDERQKTKGG
jgi:hypothetical protein